MFVPANIAYIAPPSKELLQFVNSIKSVIYSDESLYDETAHIPPPLPELLLHRVNLTPLTYKSLNNFISE